MTKKDKSLIELGKIIKKSQREIYRSHPVREYILKTYKNKKELIITWRLIPIQPDASGKEKEYIGEYWYNLRLLSPYNGFKRLEKTKMYYFKTLKELKIAINKEFKRYGYREHYKIGKER